MEKLVIASSVKFQDKIKYWNKYFTDKGYNVIKYPEKINQDNIEEYKKVYLEFYKSLLEADIVFVLNEDKNGIEGYIGAETFAELSYAIVQNAVNNANKKIYLLKMPSKDVACYVEIRNFIELGWIQIYNKND